MLQRRARCQAEAEAEAEAGFVCPPPRAHVPSRSVRLSVRPPLLCVFSNFVICSPSSSCMKYRRLAELESDWLRRPECRGFRPPRPKGRCAGAHAMHDGSSDLEISLDPHAPSGAGGENSTRPPRAMATASTATANATTPCAATRARHETASYRKTGGEPS